MTPEMMAALGRAGAMAAIAWGAFGSAFGTGTAGMASIGAWKKCFAQNKSAPFLLLIFIGAPLTQTIYGMILMNSILTLCDLATYVSADALAAASEAAAKAQSADVLSFVDGAALDEARQAWTAAVTNFPAMISAGLFGGMAMGASAWYQGKAGAAGADALADTGKGFGNYLMTIGVVETVALFVMVFLMINLG
jgi:V/A-type H+/Na+-transporting ATPase subunit K